MYVHYYVLFIIDSITLKYLNSNSISIFIVMFLNAHYVFAELKCVSGLPNAWILASPKKWIIHSGTEFQECKWNINRQIAVRCMDAVALL